MKLASSAVGESASSYQITEIFVCKPAPIPRSGEAHFQQTPWIWLCQATGVAPCKGEGVAERSPRSLGVSQISPTMFGMNWLNDVKWDAQGLVPVIAQELGSKDVLMFAWMNREALQKTAELGRAVYFSRSRNKLWFKGEESGHVQTVHEIRMDCDNDVLLLMVTQTGHEPGIACHTGRHSCFFSLYRNGAWEVTEPVLKDPSSIYK